MKKLLALLSILYLLFLFSCATTGPNDSEGLKQNEIDAWLNTVSSGLPAAINVEGQWMDTDKGSLGWGEGYISQEGNKISGYIENQNVRGVVSGRTTYLVFYSDGIVNYTARLEMVENRVLEGQYFEANDREQKNGYSVKFIIKR